MNRKVTPPLVGNMTEREIPSDQDLTDQETPLCETSLQKKPGRGRNSLHGTRFGKYLSDADGA